MLIALAYRADDPAVQGSNLYDFHYPPLAPFFVWLALYALEARKNVLAAVAIALTLSVREDIAAGVVIVGLYLLFWQRRVRAGLIVAAIGGVYFVAMKLVIMPRIAGESKFVWIFEDLLPKGEGSYGGVLKTVFTNPIYTVSTLLVPKKLVYALQIFVPSRVPAASALDRLAVRAPRLLLPHALDPLRRDGFTRLPVPRPLDHLFVRRRRGRAQ